MPGRSFRPFTTYRSVSIRQESRLSTSRKDPSMTSALEIAMQTIVAYANATKPVLMLKASRTAPAPPSASGGALMSTGWMEPGMGGSALPGF